MIVATLPVTMLVAIGVLSARSPGRPPVLVFGLAVGMVVLGLVAAITTIVVFRQRFTPAGAPRSTVAAGRGVHPRDAVSVATWIAGL